MTQDLQVAQGLQRSQAISGPRRELFRAESLQEQRTLWLGRHTLSLGLPAALSSLASTVLVSAAAALVAFCTQFGEMDHDKPEVSIVGPPDASPATMEAVRSGDAQVPANSGVCHKAIRAGDRGTGKGCTR